MANPNLGAISSIFGKTTANTTIGTSMTPVLTVASNRVYKVNTLLISNISDTLDVLISADVDKGSQQAKIVDNVILPVGAAFTGIDRTIPVYLEEGDVLRVSSNVASNVNVLVSYEDIG